MKIHWRKVAIYLASTAFWVAAGWRWPTWARWTLQLFMATLTAACFVRFKSVAEFERCLRAGWHQMLHPRCQHKQMCVAEWTASDGTPMVASWCPDCDWRDCGPIYR